jgi:hypothetical protein
VDKEEKKLPLIKLGEKKEQFKLKEEDVKKLLGCCTSSRTINKAKKISIDYNTQIFAASFTAKESEEGPFYDYYDIKLIVSFFHNNELPSKARILPKGYNIVALPVHRHQENDLRIITPEECPVSPLSWSPQRIAGQTIYTTSNQFTFNGNVGFPSGGGLGFGYTRTSSFTRSLNDIEIYPNLQDNKTAWVIKYHHLNLKGGKKGFNPIYSTQEEFRWLWKINKETGQNHLYRPKDNKYLFDFKVQLNASFLGLGYLRNRIVSGLNVYGNEDPIISVKVPSAPEPSPQIQKISSTYIFE